jgi:hypothetical protein
MKYIFGIISMLIAVSTFGQTCPSTDSIPVPTSSIVIDMEITGTDVWILTDDTLMMYDGSTWSYIDGQTANFPSDTLVDITSDNIGNIWIHSKDTLSVYNGISIVNYAFPDTLHSITSGDVNDFFVDTLGNAWLLLMNDSSDCEGCAPGVQKDVIEFDGTSFISHGSYNILAPWGAPDFALSFNKATNEVYFYTYDGMGTYITAIYQHSIGYISNNGYSNYAFSNANISLGYGFGLMYMFGPYVDACTWNMNEFSDVNYLIPIDDSCSFIVADGMSVKLFRNKTLSNSGYSFRMDFTEPIVEMKDDVNGIGYVALGNYLIRLDLNNPIERELQISSDVICSGDSAFISTNLMVDSIVWHDWSTPDQTGFQYDTTTTAGQYVNIEGNYVATMIYTTSYGGTCKAKDSVELLVVYPYASQEICLVTVDSLSGYNKIIFEKPSNAGIVDFNIYKETIQSNVYELISSLPYDSLSEFVDTLSFPNTVSARYKISVVDSCNNESELSDEHKTIHLASNVGVGGEVNLSWNAYEGFAYSTFDIYRGTSSTNLTLLSQVQSNLFSFTDQNPPSGSVFYQAIVNSPNGCSTNKMAGQYDFTLSNKIEIYDGASGVKHEDELHSFRLYPNPANTTITISGIEDGEVKIFNTIGERLYSGKLEQDTQVDIKRFDAGLYLVKVEYTKGVKTIKLVVK